MYDTLIGETKTYLQNVQMPDGVDLLSGDVDKSLFSAIEDIKDYFPDMTLTPRMVYLQAVYVAESESEGFGVLKRHNVKDYTVKDVKVVFEHQKLSPILLSIFDDILAEEQKKGRGRIGRLI